jgi:hypothetical protein
MSMPETIAAVIAEPDGEVRSLGTIPNRVESVRKLLKKLGSVGKLRVCSRVRPRLAHPLQHNSASQYPIQFPFPVEYRFRIFYKRIEPISLSSHLSLAFAVLGNSRDVFACARP